MKKVVRVKNLSILPLLGEMAEHGAKSTRAAAAQSHKKVSEMLQEAQPPPPPPHTTPGDMVRTSAATPSSVTFFWPHGIGNPRGGMTTHGRSAQGHKNLPVFYGKAPY